MIEFLKTDNVIMVLLGIIAIILVIAVWTMIAFYKHKKEYKVFLKNIGNGADIKETLDKHMEKVREVEKVNEEIINYCQKIDDKMDECIQKIGIVRYSAYRDTGSDLSFAVALLDNNNNGIVFNGIYSRELSNIYAKPVEKGKSKYKLIDEEIQAIEKAINNKQ